MALAQAQIQVGALHGGLEADALDLQVLDVTRGHARDHVRHEAARKAVERLRLARLVFTRESQFLLVHRRLDLARQGIRELAFGTLDSDFPGRAQVNLHLVGNLNELIAYA